jgi:hypothetical protein
MYAVIGGGLNTFLKKNVLANATKSNASKQKDMIKKKCDGSPTLDLTEACWDVVSNTWLMPFVPSHLTYVTAA